MKNRMTAVVVLGLLVCLSGGMVVASDATVLKRTAAGRQGLQVAASLNSDDRASLKETFEKSGGMGRDLLTAALLSDGLSADRYEELDLGQVLGSLDYVSSKSARLAIPKTNYEVVIDWGFAGAGEDNLSLMLPLPTVEIKLEKAEEEGTPMRLTGVLAFGKIVLENELNKLAATGNGDLTQVLQASGINPILRPRAIFLLKLALLVQHTLKTQDINFFCNELGILLCRLVLSRDINLPGSTEGSLTALLPASVVSAMNGQAPALLPIVERVFATAKKLFSPASSEEALKGEKTLVYVFNNNAAAAQDFEAYAPAVLEAMDSEEQLDAFLTTKNMQSIDWDDFLEVHSGALATGGITSFNLIVGKLVAYGSDVSELIETGLFSHGEAASLGVAGTVKSFAKGPFTVVTCKTDKAFFDATQTFSALAATVAKAWEGYITVIKKETAQGHELSAAELLLPSAKERAQLRTFLKSKRGQHLSERLEGALRIASDPYEKARAKQAKLVAALEAAEEEQVKVARALDEKERARTALVAQYNTSLQHVIYDMDRDIAKYREMAAQAESRIEKLTANLERVSQQLEDNTIDAKRLEMNKLMLVLRAQQAKGQAGDADVRRRIVELQREMEAEEEATAQLQAEVGLSDEDRLKVRAEIAKVYQTELEEVKKELEELEARLEAAGADDLSLSDDEEENADDESNDAVATLTELSQLELYKRYLDIMVARIQEQQKGLTKLVNYRAAAAQGAPLNADREAEFYDLEGELGFILDTRGVREICRVTKPRLSPQKRFIQELVHPARGSAFEGMHKKFITDLTTVMKRSSFAHENEVMAKYLLGMFFPAGQSKVVQEIFAQAEAVAGAR